MKYHINKETGRVNICRATEKRGCPLGVDTPHFANKEAAHKYIEDKAKNENKTFTKMSKSKIANDAPILREQTLTKIKKDVLEANNNYKNSVNALYQFNENLYKYESRNLIPTLELLSKRKRMATLNLNLEAEKYKYFENGGTKFDNRLGIAFPVGSIVNIETLDSPTVELTNSPKKESKKSIMGKFKKDRENSQKEPEKFKIIYSDGNTVRVLNLDTNEERFFTISDKNEKNTLENQNFKFISKGVQDGRNSWERYTDAYQKFLKDFSDDEKVTIYGANKHQNEDNGIYRIVNCKSETQKITLERESDNKLLNIEKEGLISGNYYNFVKTNNADYHLQRITVNEYGEKLPYPIN